MASAVETRNLARVAKTGDLKDGQMIEVKVEDKPVLLARVGNKYYAADSVCPHMGANLSQGTLEGTVVTCPRHASRFDLIDGRVVRWTDWTGVKASLSKLFKPPRPLKVYPVKVEGDDILVET